MQIPKAAMRAADNAMRGYIPHSGIVSAGAKIMEGHQSKEKKQGSSKKISWYQNIIKVEEAAR